MKHIVEYNKDSHAFRCPCCGYRTLPRREHFDICEVCFWEDDGQDDHDADVARGGPNGRRSLTQCRENFKSFGACAEHLIKYTRPPLPEEL